MTRTLLASACINLSLFSASWGNPAGPLSRAAAASDQQVGVADRFVRTFGHPTEPDYGLSVVRVTDGYVVAGNTLGYGAGVFDGFLTKIDFNGNLRWSKAYGTEINQYFYHVLQTQDAGLLAVGVVLHPRPDGETPCLAIRTDADGNLLWSKEFRPSDGCTTAVVTKDGGFALAATAVTPAGTRHISLIRLDQSGNLLWAKSFGGSVKETPYALVQTSDGGFVIAGSSNSFFIRYGPYIIKTSPSGDLQWSRTIALSDESGFQYRGSATFARELGAGELIVSGWVDMVTTEGISANGFLIQFNSDGEMRWFRRIRLPYVDVAIWGFDFTSDNQIIALGSAPLLNVFAVDWYGQVLWSNRLAPLTWGNQIVVDPDNKAVVTGYAPGTLGPGTDALLVKLDNGGQTGCDNSLALRVLEGAPAFDSPPTEEGTPAVTVTDYALQVNGAMDTTREICTPQLFGTESTLERRSFEERE